MSKRVIRIAALFGAAAVGIGAFGAHGLKEVLIENNRADTFETAVKYHFYHVFGAVLIGLIMTRTKERSSVLNFAALSMFIGIVLFSGSLYILSLTGLTFLGAITPLGGVFFILGWILLFTGVKSNL